MTTLTLVKGAKALDKDAAASLRDRALVAAHANTRVSIEYAEVLWSTFVASVTVSGDPISVWELWDYKSWKDYVETELGSHFTPARIYVRMYEKFYVELEEDWDKSLLVSMTKMVALTRVVKKTNVEWWLRRAAKMTCCQLDEAIVQALYGIKARKDLRHFAALMTNRELSSVNAILEVAEPHFPKANGRGALLLAMLEEWYGIHKAKGQRSQMKALAGGKK